jgi:hypothetical protein
LDEVEVEVEVEVGFEGRGKSRWEENAGAPPQKHIKYTWK